MMGKSRRRFSVLLMAASLGFGACGGGALAEEGGLVTFETSELAIETARGERHRFRVEFAATHAQRAQGLMYRPSLAPDAGMLFDYGRETLVAMWMKNTFIPLDILFIAANGVIVNIAERTVPGSLASISSAGPVRAVLEINGGAAERLEIKPGDRVVHPIFRGGR